MEVEQLNKLIKKIPGCESHLETYCHGKKTRVQFRELSPVINRVTAFFTANGLQKGNRIGIIGTNSYEWVVIDLACVATGVVTVALDPAMHHSINKVVDEFELSLVLTNIPGYKNQPGSFSFEHVCSYGTLDAGNEFIPVSYGPEDILTYKLTSGTTSEPKIILAMKQSVDAALTYTQQMFGHGKNDKLMVFLPLHIYQQRYWIYSAILFNHDLVVVPKEYVFYAAVAAKPTVIMGVPFFYEMMMKNFLLENDNVPAPYSPVLRNKFHEQFGGNIRYLWTGSAPIGINTLAFYDEMKLPLFQGYGMNEICIVSKNYPGHNKPGSAGKSLPGKEIVFDENGQILVKSKYPVNTSYFSMENTTNRTFREDGFVATGDTGYIDDEGYLFIDGRIKELIILASSAKVHPVAVEKKMESSPLIRHCIVYGDLYPYLVALIARSKPSITNEEIREAVTAINEGLAPHQRVCNFLITDEDFTGVYEVPSAQNKIQRNAILDRYREQLEMLYSN